MATKRLSMRQIREILRLKYEQQLSHRAVAGACRVSLGTVSEYLGRSRRAGLDWPCRWIWTIRRWKRGCFRRQDRRLENVCFRIWSTSTRS